MKPRFILLAAVVGMGAASTACAPVYQDFRQYAPPADPLGQSCVAEALAERRRCEAERRTAYEACRDERRDEAEAALRDARFDYRRKKNDYEWCAARATEQAEETYQRDRENDYVRRLAQEEYERCLEEAEKAGFGYCSEPIDFDPGLNRWDIEQAVRVACGEKPEEPELRDFEDYSACAAPGEVCLNAYDAAYAACGGQVQVETRCVKYCD